MRGIVLLLALLLLSLVAPLPSTARPAAVETLELEPTPGTIPPMEWRMWLLPVAGSPGDTE